MKQNFFKFMPLVGAVIASAALLITPADAQLLGSKGGKRVAKSVPGGGPVERIGTVEIDQPNFGGPGVWGVPYITDMAVWMTDHDEVPFTELGKAKFEARRETHSALDPEGYCMPPGVPRMMYTPYPMKFIQQPDMITMIFEGGTHIWREIPIGPKGWLKLPPVEELNPTYLGHSIGWWEGDTLVVETTGFNDRTWLDFAGHPHGEQLKVVERFDRVDSLNMRHTAIIEDPEYYTEPWTVTINIAYQPDNYLLEYICQENERDSRHQEELLIQEGYDLELAR